MFGILNINKSSGMTSHDVVQVVRKKLKIKQVGHSGTLDPMATGVLPVFIGKATRLIEYFDEGKGYKADFLLGVETDSYDTEGELLFQNKVKVEPEKIKKALKFFEGKIEQIPPMHSAVHYKGKRLYEYARKKIEIEDIPKRTVFIENIELLDIKEGDNPVVTVKIDCSKGTYIRSIVHDLGEILGTGACMSALERTRSGSFEIKDSISLEDLETGRFKLINPLDFLNMQKVEINEEEIEKIKMGQSISCACEEEIVALKNENSIIAIAKNNKPGIQPIKVFVNSANCK